MPGDQEDRDEELRRRLRDGLDWSEIHIKAVLWFGEFVSGHYELPDEAIQLFREQVKAQWPPVEHDAGGVLENMRNSAIALGRLGEWFFAALHTDRIPLTPLATVTHHRFYRILSLAADELANEAYRNERGHD